MKNQTKYKLINRTNKKEVKALENKEYIKTNSETNNKNWKKQEKKSKNMAIFNSPKLYSPAISRNHFFKRKIP